MNCGEASPSGYEIVACALRELQGEWWEPWLQALSVVLSVLVPALIAVLVARHSRKATLEAVQIQIDEAREAAARQVLADRAERRDDELRAKVGIVAEIADRQMVTKKEDWYGDVVAFSASLVGMLFALNLHDRQIIQDWFSKRRLELLRIRKEMTQDPRRDGKLLPWQSGIRTVCEMLIAGADVEQIARMMHEFDDDLDRTPHERLPTD